MNLIKYMRVGAALLAIAASVSPVCAMQTSYGPNGQTYGPNASGTNPWSRNGQNTRSYHGPSQGNSLLGTFTSFVTGATKKINEMTANVQTQRGEVSRNSPTNAAANFTGELKAAQTEVKSTMTALQEAGSAVRGFFGMLPTPWSIGAAVVGYKDQDLNDREEITVGDEGLYGYQNRQGVDQDWFRKGQTCWRPKVKTAGALFKHDVMNKIHTNVVPVFWDGNKVNPVTTVPAVLTALMTMAVFKEEITGAVKSIARKLLPKRFFEDKPANGGILFSNLSPAQQKYVQSQVGMNPMPQSRYSVRGQQQNASQYYNHNLNAKASELYQRGWFGYSRKR